MQPLAAVVFVSRRVFQKSAVKLLDVVLGQWNVMPGIEDEVRRIGVPGNLLFVPRTERSKIEVREQEIDFPVRELGPFDSCGRPDRLYRRYMAQCRQTVRR